MLQSVEVSSQKRVLILNASIPIFGRFGFKKTSVDDLAKAAKISKQGLYLHFSSKEEVFFAAIQKYLDDGLSLVEQELSSSNTSLFNQLMGAMDAWFGRHLVTFTPESFDVIEASNQLLGNRVEEYKSAFPAKIEQALEKSPEFNRAKNVCTPKEISQVLFQFGLTWKEGHLSRADFMRKVSVCICACCQIEGRVGNG